MAPQTVVGHVGSRAERGRPLERRDIVAPCRRRGLSPMLLLIALLMNALLIMVIAIIVKLGICILSHSSTEAEAAPEDDCFFCSSDDVASIR